MQFSLQKNLENVSLITIALTSHFDSHSQPSNISFLEICLGGEDFLKTVLTVWHSKERRDKNAKAINVFVQTELLHFCFWSNIINETSIFKLLTYIFILARNIRTSRFAFISDDFPVKL